MGRNDYGILLEQLHLCAAEWETIAAGLRYTNDEIKNIKADPTNIARAPRSYLEDIIGKWLHWAPGDARGSKDGATLEALKRAVSQAGFGNIAENLTLSERSHPQDGMPNNHPQAQSSNSNSAGKCIMYSC